LLRRSGVHIKLKKQREGDTVVKYCGDAYEISSGEEEVYIISS